jgi:hypothetical protein
LSPSLQWSLAGLILAVVAVLLWSPWLASVAIAAISLEVLRRLTGETDRPAFSFWLLLLLLLLLPVGLHWDGRLAFWIRDTASGAGSLVLDFIGCDHVLTNGLVRVPGQEWRVESLLRGMFAPSVLIAAAAILAIQLRRPIARSLLLVGSAFFWSGIGSVIRVTCVVGAHENTGRDLATGFGSGLLGLSWFGVGLWMLFCTDRLLIFLLAPIPSETEVVGPCFPWQWVQSCGEMFRRRLALIRRRWAVVRRWWARVRRRWT